MVEMLQAMDRFLIVEAIMMILLTAATLAKANDAQGLTVCTVQPSTVREGEPAIIVCYFPVDIDSSNTTVIVTRTSVDSKGNDSPDEILKYSNERGMTRYVYYKKGYLVVEITQREMRILISSAAIGQAGNYSCKRVPVSYEEVRQCTLEVKPKISETSCRVQPVSLGQTASLVCQFNVNLLQGRRDIIVKKQSESGVFHGRSVFCSIKPKQNQENGYACRHELNDCPLKQEDPVIDCLHSNTKFFVDKASVTTSTLTVHVVNVSRNSEGFYVCKLGSTSEQHALHCQLSLTGSAGCLRANLLVIGIVCMLLITF